MTGPLIHRVRRFAVATMHALVLLGGMGLLHAQSNDAMLLVDSAGAIRPSVLARGGSLFVVYTANSDVAYLARWTPGVGLTGPFSMLGGFRPDSSRRDTEEDTYSTFWSLDYSPGSPGMDAYTFSEDYESVHAHRYRTHDGFVWESTRFGRHSTLFAAAAGWRGMGGRPSYYLIECSTVDSSGRLAAIGRESISTDSVSYKLFDSAGNAEAGWRSVLNFAGYDYTALIALGKDSVLAVVDTACELLRPHQRAQPYFRFSRRPVESSVSWCQQLTGGTLLRSYKIGQRLVLERYSTSGQLLARGEIDSVVGILPQFIHDHPGASFALVYRAANGCLTYFVNERTLKASAPVHVVVDTNMVLGVSGAIQRDTLSMVWQRGVGPAGKVVPQGIYGGSWPIPPGIVPPDDASDVAADAATSGTASLSIAVVTPNPAHGRADVELRGVPGAEVRVELFDLLGVPISRAAITLPAGGRAWQALDLGGLPTGTYLVRAADGAGSITARRIVLR